MIERPTKEHHLQDRQYAVRQKRLVCKLKAKHPAMTTRAAVQQAKMIMGPPPRHTKKRNHIDDHNIPPTPKHKPTRAVKSITLKQYQLLLNLGFEGNVIYNWTMAKASKTIAGKLNAPVSGRTV